MWLWAETGPGPTAYVTRQISIYPLSPESSAVDTVEMTPEMTGHGQEPRFIADRMLGRLARYLRLLGYDTSYPPPGPDAHLVAKAQAEGRILLTRDHGIFAREGPRNGSPQVVEIVSDEVLGQIEQLADEGLLGDIGDPRCSACNHVLSHIAETEARHLMPPFTGATHCTYLYCRSCNIVLWEGSHWERFRGRIYRTLFEADRGNPARQG